MFFLGHGAMLGCSKCPQLWWHLASWPLRTNSDHQQRVGIVLANSTTKTKQATVESEQGCRYSALLELQYFDPVRMLVIDPMHNMLLGTGKRMIHVWIDQALITKADFESLTR